ncbi:MAG: EAL domain-containing protein [Acidimicrobiia bacterium]
MSHDQTGEIPTMLRRVLGDGGVHAVLQPIRRDGQPVMVEALARFPGPLGAHPVEQVIAVAEAVDVVHTISEIVLEDALILVRAAPHWNGQVAWNVSPAHLRRRDFIPRLDAILTEHRFPIERLVIEVTESTLSDDHDLVQALASLRGRGAMIALDDFGTGWSSISRLATLPVDIVKIDRSLINDVTSRRGGDIVRSVMSLCEAIGAVVVVEGVETVAQLDALERLHDGTHLVQGFLTGRPTGDIDVALIAAVTPVEHTVCFYDTDDAFTDEISKFVAAGHAASEPTVAVLTLHRTARVRAELRRRGIDPDSSTISFQDADSTLQSILTDGNVDPVKFHQLTSTLIARHPMQRMRCCGEMVTMLWNRGDVLGALLLEDLWNRLAGGPTVTILCGYPSAIAAHPADQLAVEVLHSDRYTTAAGTTPTPPEREERRRTAELHALGLLTRTPDDTFDAVTDLAIKVFDTDYAFISLIDTDRQWFASRTGFADTDSARDVAFCAHTIMSDEPLIVHDTRRDRRFHENPFVTSPPHIIFYAGAPIHAPNGSRIGTVCVASSNPRRFSQPDRRHLTHLADIVDNLISQRAEAVTDQLTGLYNRRGFLDSLHRLASQPTDDDLTIVVADIDGLKALNDTRGHAAGDRALSTVAAALNDTLQDAAIIARIGGDEFAAIYAGAEPTAKADTQIAKAVQRIDTDALPIGLSAATATRQPGDTARSLLARVDRTMYANKRDRARHTPRSRTT